MNTRGAVARKWFMIKFEEGHVVEHCEAEDTSMTRAIRRVPVSIDTASLFVPLVVGILEGLIREAINRGQTVRLMVIPA